MIDDEAEIQKQAYEIIRNLNSRNFSPLLELKYYLERSYKDFEGLVNLYVNEELKRGEILEKVKAMISMKNANMEEIRIKSYCRLNVLEKKST